MIQEIELNGVKVKVEITKEMARKVLEESEEIEVGGDYYYRDSTGFVGTERYGFQPEIDNRRKEQDNLLPHCKYTYGLAIAYFDKRDARRAAEYRIKKAIEKMNGDKERDSEMGLSDVDKKLFVVGKTSSVFFSPTHLHFNHSIGDYMLEYHTEDYKIYFGIE